METVRLSEVARGRRVHVVRIEGASAFCRRLEDLGFTPGAAVRAELRGFLGDPLSFRILDTVIALRTEDARRVVVTTEAHEPAADDIGEGNGAIHAFEATGATPRQRPVVALAGNPNTGKSTVFNQLTGLRQHVGNWPGKTVARFTGTMTHDGRRYEVVDLPGTYSLSSMSPEEEIARDVLVFDPPDATVVVVDAARLQRNLNLVLQILEISRSVVVCLNLMDEARAFGLEIDHERLRERLGVPVVPTVARSGEGLPVLRQEVASMMASAGRSVPAVEVPSSLEEVVRRLTQDIVAAHPAVANPRWVALRLMDDADEPLQRALRQRLGGALHVG
jgi:GTP-binding protein